MSFYKGLFLEGCDYAAKESGIPAKTIAELGFAIINERMGKGEDFKAKDGSSVPESVVKVPIDQTAEYLAQGYQITKLYENTAILTKPAITTEKTTPTQDDDTPKESQQDRLIKYCLEETVEFFYDQHHTPYARINEDLRYCAIDGNSLSLQPCIQTIKTGGDRGELDKHLGEEQIAQPQKTNTTKKRLVTIPIHSKRFKTWLAYLMYERELKAPGSEAVNSAINVLMGKALKEGKEHVLYNRVAPAEDGIWLDMCDDQWRAIKITQDSWEIVEQPPILFRRYSHQKPLCEPIKAATEEEAAKNALKLLDHVNIKAKAEDDPTRLAVICTCISYLIPLIPHPIMVIYGPQGSAKSYLHKIVRRLLDPSVIELLGLPHDDNEIIQQLDHNWLCFYDNLTYLPSSVSDIFCRAATGSGFSKRELYSDDDDIIYAFKRCLGVNGINPAARKGDFLDRSMMVQVTKIDNKDRKTEAEVDVKFEVEKALILGGFLSVLSKALKEYPNQKLEGYQRLADFNRYGCAIAIALGKTAEEFNKAYESKVESQVDEALNAEPVGLAMVEFCEKHFALDGKKKPLHENWIGTPALLFQLVTTTAESLGIKTDYRSSWPKAPHAFTRKLNEITPSLIRKNFEVVIKPGTPRQIIITYGTQTLLVPKTPKPVDDGKRKCGSCFKFHKPECSFPSGPINTGINCDYAEKCQDFSLEKTVPTVPETQESDKFDQQGPDTDPLQGRREE